MEVVCKVYAVVVNYRLKRSATVHNVLHVLSYGRDTGTVTLESKLAKQLAGIAHNPMFQVFLDVREAYDSLDRGL